jgi:multiple sugar transport system substrate-binding protein
LLSALALTVTACGGGGGSGGGGGGGNEADAGSGKGTILIWAHQGVEAEVKVLQTAVTNFNGSQSDVTAKLQLIPEGDYTKTIQATNADKLPDVMEFDGPLMSSFVYDGKLAPLTDMVSSEVVGNQSDSVKSQNTYPADKALYGLSLFDSGLGIYGNKKLLDAAGIDYPKGLDDAWTADEFQADLQKLAAKDSDRKVLDIKENYGGEWPTYGFLPVLNSAGAVVETDGKATGNLNSPSAVKAVQQFAGWRKYVDPNSDDKAFTDGRVALSWVGHWVYNGYDKELGKNLVLMPLPDFGAGPKTGQGSWAWGIGGGSKNGKAAGVFLDFLMQDETVKAMTDANGAPPGTKTVTATSALYKQGGPLQLFADGLAKTCGTKPPAKDCVAISRPVTAAYPVISSQFSRAFFNAYKGGDAQSEIDKAAKAIDQDYEDNGGYKN